MVGETVEQPFRSVPRRLTDTASVVGAGVAPVLTLAQTIQLQLQWADLSLSRGVLFTINANTGQFIVNAIELKSVELLGNHR